MHKKYYDFFKVLDCAIQNKREILPADFDVNEGFELAKRHRMVSMYFYGLINCGYKKLDSNMKKFFADVCTEVLIDERQKYELSKIEKVFNENGIDYMLLKGSHLKSLYPRSEMRSMGDLDILIKLEQYDVIKTLLLALGFKEGIESDHEILWNNENCIIELHKHLIPSYNFDYYDYFSTGWQFAVKNQNSRYFMSDEDNFVYLFTHFAKHYRDRGIGIKPLIDLRFLMLNQDLDMNYVTCELKKLKLDNFFGNIMHLIGVWFENEESNNVSEFLSKRIIENPAYGNRRNMVLSLALREQKFNKPVFVLRAKRIIKSLFVPFRNMSKFYPSLKRFPFLLPFMWLYHFFKRLVQKEKRYIFAKDVSLLNKKQVINYQKELNFVGLDYNFEE